MRHRTPAGAVAAAVVAVTAGSPLFPQHEPSERARHSVVDLRALEIVHYGEPLHPGMRVITLLPGEHVRLTVAGRGVACTAASSSDDAPALELRACTDDATPSLDWETDGGTITQQHGSATALRYQAPPTPGTYRLRLRARGDDGADDGRELAVLVLTPFEQKRGASLSGYVIGDYPDQRERTPGGGRRNYGGRGFAAVTADNQDLRLSEHFLLRDFLCKQQPDHFPKYVVLDLRLLDKLERLVDRLTVAGRRAPHLAIMSGYRTPYYNRAIGNTTESSRHILGDAADVFVDDDGDGMMDDLDHDGTVTRADAEALLRIVDTLDREERFPGGAAAYAATPAHGPFVHVDTRGYRTRW